MTLEVIALGDHKFDAACYPGGLPGDGWGGEKKFTATGETVDGVTKIVAEGIGHAIIARAVFDGLSVAVSEMRRLMTEARAA